MVVVFLLWVLLKPKVQPYNPLVWSAYLISVIFELFWVVNEPSATAEPTYFPSPVFAIAQSLNEVCLVVCGC